MSEDKMTSAVVYAWIMVIGLFFGIALLWSWGAAFLAVALMALSCIVFLIRADCHAKT